MKYLQIYEKEDSWRKKFKNTHVVFVDSELTKKYKFKIGEIVYTNDDKYKYQITAIDLEEVLKQPYRLCSLEDDSIGTWASENRLKYEYQII